MAERQAAVNEEDDDEGKDIAASCSNAYHTPGLITLLLDQFLHIYPLWSALLLGDLGTYTQGNKSCNQAPAINQVTNALY